MNKDLSQEERGTLASEFTYQGKKPGMIGGYCEADFPLYYANEEMAELLGYGSVEELAAGIGGRVANTIHPDDMPRVEKDLGGHFYEGMTYETTYRMPRRDGSWFWTVDKGKVIRAEARHPQCLHGYERLCAAAAGAGIEKYGLGSSFQKSAGWVCPLRHQRGSSVPLYRRAIFEYAWLDRERGPHEV